MVNDLGQREVILLDANLVFTQLIKFVFSGSPKHYQAL